MYIKSISIIPNGALQTYGRIVKTNRLTGKFIEDLSTCCSNVTVVGFYTNNDGFYDYNISSIDNVSFVIFTPYKVKLCQYFFCIPRLWNLLMRNEFTYIFYPGTLGLISALLAVIGSRQFGLYVRGDFNRTSKRGLLNYIAKILDTFIIRKASFIFTTGSHFKTILSSVNNAVQVVSPMIEVTMGDLYEMRSYKSNTKKTILFVSRLHKEKGVFVLLKALKRLREDNLHFHCYCVGTGHCISEITNYTTYSGLNDYITITGHIANDDILKCYYRKSDIFVMPSFSEGFPRTLYEAMTFGMAIITTFVGSVCSLMIDRHNCLKINPDDVDGLYLKLRQLLTDDSLRKMLGQNALQTMKIFFSNIRQTHAMQVCSKINETLFGVKFQKNGE